MNAADYLLDLIRCHSVPTASNRGVIEYAQRVLRLAGWTTREIPYLDSLGIEKLNLISAPPKQDVSAYSVDLAFVCHTDTAPYAASWTRALDPFIEQGHLYGCGACDVKGFLACLLAVASDPHPDWRKGLRIILTADEEVGCIGAKHLLAMDLIKPMRLVIGEPTSLRVARAGKGYSLAEIVVQGVEAHSAHPDQGASAIFAAGRMIRSIEGLACAMKLTTHQLFSPSYTSLNVGTIRGGTAKNIVPGECRFLVEWRPIPGLDANDVPSALRGFADTVHREDPRIRCNIHLLRQQAGFETSEDSDLVQALVSATGNPSTSIPFGSEASILAPGAKESVVFGPGDMRTAHSERECVPLRELDIAVEIVAKLMIGR